MSHETGGGSLQVNAASSGGVPAKPMIDVPPPDKTGGEGNMQSPIYVISQTGVTVRIIDIKCLHIGAGYPSPMHEENDRYYHVMAEIYVEKDEEAPMVELRRNLAEHEAKAYCDKFTDNQVDFIWWDDGKAYINPRYAHYYTESMLPRFGFDK